MLVAGLLALTVQGLGGVARAQDPRDPTATTPTATVPTVTMIGASPLLGTGLDRNKVPAASHVVTGDDVVRTGIPDALGALNDQVPGVALDDAQGNPFQPNLVYRGFSASPLDGNAQGLAVYLNGVRFNQPFADTVNWDLLPSIAIDRMNLEGSNPVFGLNALGGSLSVRLKDGFSWHGNSAEIFGGSFGTIGGSFQSGQQSGNTATYIAGSLQHSDGWRQLGGSDIRHVYGDVGWRAPDAELHLNMLLADNTLNGPGTAPVQLLAADRSAVFTAPNLTTNKYALISLSGTWAVSDATSVQSLLYYSNLSQRIQNGNTPNAQPCASLSGFLCTDGDNLAFDRNGQPITDFLNGGPYAQLNLEATDTNGYGTALQMTHGSEVFGLHNQLVAGVSFDGGVTTFSASSTIGGIDSQRQFVGPGVVVDQPDGSIAPVRLGITNAYYGVYVSDVLDLTSRLSLSVSGRMNMAQIDLNDQTGTALNGNHTFNHFNPGVGLTYKLLPNVSVYASYSEANRAPTPAELSCASAATPCTLANFFVGDPSLKQVVAHTIEAGVRGRLNPTDEISVDWSLGLFHTISDDDILFVASAIPGTDFFQNVGSTRRQGVETGLTLHGPRFKAWLNYAYTDATFATALTLDSPLNPGADANGQIHVVPGDHLPGVPQHRLKFGVDYMVTDAWTIGLSGIASSGQYLFGDEANLEPKTNPYVVLNANTRYQVTDKVQLFALLQNMFNANYETYGTFSPTNTIAIAQAPGATNTRSLSPAAPLAIYGGIRVTF
ncbi:MAG: iron complex outerrane recepter protein [Acetobacteraceae bacterium]|nr:iron complex outerrane recepter protein [Acetobacteraceae bacterium]